MNESKEKSTKDNVKSAKEELYNEIIAGYKVINDKSGVSAKVVFDKTSS